MVTPENQFDDDVMDLLQLDEEGVKTLRDAILNLNYELLYKTLWEQHEKYVRTVNRSYICLVVAMSVLIVLELIRWFFRW